MLLTTVWISPSRRPRAGVGRGRVADQVAVRVVGLVVGRADALAGVDDAAAVEVGTLAVAEKGRRQRTLLDLGDAVGTEGVPGRVGRQGGDPPRRVEVGGEEEVVLAAREAGPEDCHRPAAGGRRPGGDDQGEADPLGADGPRRAPGRDVGDDRVGVGLVARHQEAAEGVVAGAGDGRVEDLGEGERPGGIGVDLVAAVDLGHRRGREHVPGAVLDEGGAGRGTGVEGCPQVGQLGCRRLGREVASAGSIAGGHRLAGGVADAAADDHPVAGRLEQEGGGLAGEHVGGRVPDQLDDRRPKALRPRHVEVGRGDRGDLDRPAEGDRDPRPEVEPVLQVRYHL